MALPPNATAWANPMDPTDLVDYVAEFRGEDRPVLEDGEHIDSFTVTMSPEGASLGVTISEEVGYEAALLEGDTAILIWLYVEEAEWANTAFEDDGVQLAVTFTIETNSSPSRRYQRTFILQVAQQ